MMGHYAEAGSVTFPHPWLAVDDLITRVVIGCCLEQGASEELDQRSSAR